jgi:transcriptional regulator with XRE-family HTH domain
MTDVSEFKIAVIRAGISMNEIAQELKITRGALWKKVHNKSDFRQLELAKLFELLNLDTWEKRQRIFFAHEVE